MVVGPDKRESRAVHGAVRLCGETHQNAIVSMQRYLCKVASSGTCVPMPRPHFVPMRIQRAIGLFMRIPLILFHLSTGERHGISPSGENPRVPPTSSRGYIIGI